MMNLKPNQRYTMVSSCKPQEDAKAFIAYAHYISNDNGAIDVDTKVSLGGTYFCTESMGLMWSLTAEKGVQAVEIYSSNYNDRIYMKEKYYVSS